MPQNQRTRVRHPNRVVLGEISTNLKSDPDTMRPLKAQVPARYDDVTQKSHGQNENVYSAQFPATFGGLCNVVDNRKNEDKPSGSFTSQGAEIPPTKKSLQAPIGSERAASRSHSNNSAASANSLIERLVPKMNHFDSFGGSDVSTEESPMVVDPECQMKKNSDSMMDVDEYSICILDHMKKNEPKYLPKWNYMRRQPDISFSMRSILVDWLVEVADEYQIHSETIFLAVNYIDRFLSSMSVQKGKLQLVGATALLIAAKFEEITPPEIEHLCYLTDDTYTKEQVLKMESLILDVLKFECASPTPLFFVNHFSKLSGTEDNSQAQFMAQYLAELTMLDAETFLIFPASVIGAASVALARHTIGLSAWDSAMAEKTGISVDDFKTCLILMHAAFTNAHEYPQQAVRAKYANRKYLSVSEIRPTPIF